MLNSDHLVAIGLLVPRQSWAALCLGRTECPIIFRARLSSLSLSKKKKEKNAAAVLRRRQEGLSLTARSATAHRLDGFSSTAASFCATPLPASKAGKASAGRPMRGPAAPAAGAGREAGAGRCAAARLGGESSFSLPSLHSCICWRSLTLASCGPGFDSAGDSGLAASVDLVSGEYYSTVTRVHFQ